MSTDQYAPAVLKAGQDLGVKPRGIVIGFATVYVESGWTMYANESVPASMNIPHEAVGSDHASVGLFQQQVVGPPWWWGDAATCMDPYKSAVLFFQRLKTHDYNNTDNSPGSYAQAVQGSAFPDRYDEHIDEAQTLYDRLTGGAPVTAPTDPRAAALLAARPEFNEIEFWCNNSQDRSGTPVDVWLIHTQEPGNLTDDDAALHLAQFLKSTEGGSNPVSYHYVFRQASDGGVTVYDVVDTDLASWSVGNSNDRAINGCFAGSGVAWSRDNWMTQAKAIDVAAYLAVQDCIKYGFEPNVIPGPAYGKNPPGISDHRYCSNWLKDGNNHDDVGDNFPWDVFASAVAKYWAIANSAQPDPTPTPAPEPAPDPATPFKYPSQAEMVKQVWEQLFGPQGGGWPQLGQRTLVDAVAELIKGGS